ncbi:DUF4412 domain-containing protein [Maribacter sp. MMG018]|uniref:DUF4412 domain-containing protein n=1 Tax=Maribacter sp. MMG018 TaxID=2822688 RepID=UPI001B35D4F8|nr:DUF4412 domain-containing protein [Maribacter sp. MMG018]MBQ4913928.1 DUF4412 domain-containing protein [Maribacter sp. MMG018]
MKAKAIVLIIVMFCFALPMNAQFFEKLAKKAEKAAERTVLNRTDKEVSKKTDKAIDGVVKEGGKKKKTTDKGNATTNGTLEKDSGLPTSMFGGANMDIVPDEYRFSYAVKMLMTTGKDKMDLTYYLEPGQTYFGSEFGNMDNITVMDFTANMILIFGNRGGQKTVMGINNNSKLYEKYRSKMVNDTNYDQAKIKEIGSKNLLGYNCSGYEVVTEEGISRIWVTNEIPIGNIYSVFYDNEAPGGLPFDKEAMIMEMDYKSNKGAKGNFHLICTDIVKKGFSIYKKDYASMGY